MDTPLQQLHQNVKTPPPVQKPRGKKRLTVLALAAGVGLMAGVAGAWLGLRFFYEPACNCNNQGASNGSTLTELANIKRFLGIKEDFYAQAVYDSVRPVIAAVYKKKSVSANTIDQLYYQSDFVAGALVLTSDGWVVAQGRVNTATMVVMHDNTVYPIDQALWDSFSDTSFIKISANSLLPVAKFGNLVDSSVDQSLLVTNVFHESVMTRIQSLHSWAAERTDFISDTDAFSQPIVIENTLPASFRSALAVNLDGEIVGFLIAGSNGVLNRLMPVDALKPAITSLLKTGAILRPSLGVRYVELSRALGVDEKITGGQKTGILVLENPRAISAAGKAGLRANDIIIRADNNEITDSQNFTLLIQGYQPSDSVEFTILRAGTEMKLSAVLEVRP